VVAVTVRVARPADAPLLAETVLLASRSHVQVGAWDLCFPGTDAERLAILRDLVTALPASFFHHSVSLVAEDDGVPAAALCAVAPRELGQFDPTPTMTYVLRARGWTREALAAMNARIAPFETCLFPAPPERLIVENVATLPAHRRRGCVRALLDAALARGRAAGCREAQLSIFIDNLAAQRAYEAVGFRVVEEKRSAAFAAAIPGCAGLACMIAPL
jgi:ribosomal protein S18 acetylase RimI-like enzyme